MLSICMKDFDNFFTEYYSMKFDDNLLRKLYTDSVLSDFELSELIAGWIDVFYESFREMRGGAENVCNSLYPMVNNFFEREKEVILLDEIDCNQLVLKWHILLVKGR